MTGSSGLGHPTQTPDFRGLDFERLWKGREKTTEVERRIVREALRDCEARRVLEIGPGGGRITPVLLATGGEYLGLDVTPRFLRRLRARWPHEASWLAADLAHLPIAGASVSTAILVRVYNFLVDPGKALRELHRVLFPGGSLLVSYFSVPSVATAVDDLEKFLGRRTTANGVRVRIGRQEALLPTRSQFRSVLHDAGFRWQREFSAGLEDFRPFRWLPAEVFVGLAKTFGTVGAIPHRFVLARRIDSSTAENGPRISPGVERPSLT
jgi:SAM-dependent methyltransferase